MIRPMAPATIWPVTNTSNRVRLDTTACSSHTHYHSKQSTLNVISKDYIPPRPMPLPALAALARALWRGDGNLLDLLPANAYQFDVGDLGYSRRSTVMFNDPVLVREILRDEAGVFPKSDLMVNALEPLIGDSIFVTDGDKWRRQRAMIDPAFSQLRIAAAYPSMLDSVAAFLDRVEGYARSGDAFSLDAQMSHLTADVICRTTFSTPLDGAISNDVFEDFTAFERSVAQVDIIRLIVKPAWSELEQPPQVLAACERIRRHLGALVDLHLDENAAYDDIASAVINARDRDTDRPFTRAELIDQLGVFFLAGHETSASALTWVFFLLAEQPAWLARLRDEVDRVVGDQPITLDHLRELPLVKAFFKETLRLYPPITFLPRVALSAIQVGRRRLRRGALVMISPWTLHRNPRYWTDPDVFRPERFTGDSDIPSEAYIPFGQGPHTCVGAGFAQMEALLIIASLVRRFDLYRLDNKPVRPAARLTTRPAQQIFVTVASRR